ncbi:hypothetical protein [Xanthomarina spongicola]|uniref:Uncharacterized protein n=1 Tax=Xanthomarina spongicola TaxID=570520 RepID=A0A316DTA5_9FLAO|nr:hypothetical protein [Xanthomarina spongicola]PWK20698.1 hypothetical protein LX78_00401 [Xanthomarina spongicola]
MSDYRNRPKGNFIQEASWQDLYMLTESWKKDLEFYSLDVKFIELLVETYFVKFLINQNLDDLRELQRELLELNKQCENLLKRIKIHFTHIVDLIEDPFIYDASVFRTEHELLEEEISEFIKMLKVVRYAVFVLSKDVLGNEKPKRIWKYN